MNAAAGWRRLQGRKLPAGQASPSSRRRRAGQKSGDSLLLGAIISGQQPPPQQAGAVNGAARRPAGERTARIDRADNISPCLGRNLVRTVSHLRSKFFAAARRGSPPPRRRRAPAGGASSSFPERARPPGCCGALLALSTALHSIQAFCPAAPCCAPGVPQQRTVTCPPKQKARPSRRWLGGWRAACCRACRGASRRRRCRHRHLLAAACAAPPPCCRARAPRACLWWRLVVQPPHACAGRTQLKPKS